MERAESWYSVIRYAPDSLKGEVVNVGLLLHEKDNKKLHFHLLDHTNIKLKALLSANDSLDLYKIHKDYIEYYLDQTPLHGDLFNPGLSNNDLISQLAKVFPSEIKLSEPNYSLTDNIDRLFDNLLASYIGKDFLKLDDSGSVSIKKYVKNVFEKKRFIDKKVKVNAKIYPLKDKETISYTVDFVYKNGVLNLLQSAPNKDNINNWFNKLAVFIDNYKSDTVYHFLLDREVDDYPEDTFRDMLDFLKSKNENIHTIDIKTSAFEELCRKIEVEGKDVSEFDAELNAV